ncbi:FAD-dependent oxidoreductase [Rhodobacteraceae bacterium CH30]|nr:FAD-dependent oxidoreductase [Rhodobacteraceae bacterium CH30]
MKRKPRVAVIGAGWAGLSAAVALADQAHLTLIEAGRAPGGRARRLQRPASTLDNGQHILIGAYRDTFALMRRVGLDPEALLLRQPLTWAMADGLSFACPRLFAPLHLLAGLLGAQGLRWREKLSLLRALSGLRLRNWRVAHDGSVSDWLAAQRQSAALVQGFWRPMVLSALNTPLEFASMQTLARVLGDSVGGTRADSDLMLPRVDLSQLLPEPAWRWLQAQGADCRTGQRVQSLAFDDGGVNVDGERFDRVIVALPPWQAAHLLSSEMAGVALQAFQARPITTVYLGFASLPALPRSMTGLARARVHWFFDREQLCGEKGQIAAVISCDAGAGSEDALVAEVLADLAGICGAVDAPLSVQVVREKRATFASSVALARPGPRMQVNYGYLAGDWVNQDYPATLEGAVRSGAAAASAVMHDWN